MEIRHIKKEDNRFAISRIYEESWKFAYQDIIPESWLNHISEGRWISNLDQEDMNHLVMLENGKFIGTSAYGKSRFADFDGFGEIISIYFLPEYMGKGYGKLLINDVIDELAKQGYRNIFLWVLEENHRARRFYEKIGFVQDEHILEDNIGGKQLREIAYLYSVEKRSVS